MIAVVQRVSGARVEIDGVAVASIAHGLLVLLGVGENDTVEDAEWLASKIVNMRIMADENAVMNLCVKDVDGDLLVVSQFTLHASTKKGNRPSYMKAAQPEVAIPLYETFLSRAQDHLGKPVQAGRFGADMKVSLTNDGPVTIIIDSGERK